jgi:hypothetical protein
MKKRRKTGGGGGGYIDRGATLAESSRRPNVDPRSIALPVNNHFKSPYRLFKYKIAVPPLTPAGGNGGGEGEGEEGGAHGVRGIESNDKGEKRCVLDAMMLKNELCVLVFNEELLASLTATGDSIDRIQFTDSLETDGFSGKRKKGAQVLKAGSSICSVLLRSGDTVQCSTPVGGQLLEMNTALTAQIASSTDAVVSSASLRAAYVAIVMPNTIVPTLDGGSSWDALLQQMKDANTKVCFAFIRGECKRGDKCKFEHKEGADASAGKRGAEAAGLDDCDDE